MSSLSVTRGRAAVSLAMLALFVVSVLLRLPYLERPMGLHHEEGTGRTLVHSEAWWEDGPSDAGYLLRTTLNNPGDKYLSGTTDEDGNAYYYSFPPGHPLWAFLAHRAVGVEPTVMSVRVFNLLLNLLSAMMIYLIVRELLRKLPDLWSRFAALAAFGVYLFTPVALWYQSNAYTSGSAVQPLFIAGLLAIAYMYGPTESESARRSAWPVVALGLLVFLMSYTEWLGLAFAGVAGAIALLRYKDPVARRIGIASVAGAVLAAALVVFQYSSALGLDGVFGTFLGRYADRSGLVDGGVGYTFWELRSWIRLSGIYVGAVGVPVLALVALYVWERIVRRGMPRRFSAGDAPASVVLSFALLPILVHHLVLFDHTVVHDFDTLKTAVPIALAIGLLVGKIVARHAAREEASQGRAMSIAGVALAVTVAAGFVVFGWLNDTVTPQPLQLGEAIAQSAEPDEVVWIESPAYVPTSITAHYSGRNFLTWKGDPASAAAVLERGEPRTGVFLLLDEYLAVQAVGYVGTDGVIRESREEARATLVR